MAAKNLPGSLQTTRQMLDELDALMERMLTLPVSGAEEPAPHAKAEFAKAERAKPEPKIETVTAATPRSPNVAASLTVIDELPPSDAPVHSPIPSMTPNYELPAASNPLEMQSRSLTVVDSEMTPHWLKPIVWTNDAYDFSTRLFGPLGGALRSGICRTMLGVVGAGLLLWALGWLIRDLIGWLP